MTKSIPLSERPAWKALQAHHQQIQGKNLKQMFAEDPQRGEMVIFVEPRILLGFSSLRYGLYYFVLATQAIALLLGLDELRKLVVRRYNAIVGDADNEMMRLVEEDRL